MGSIPQFASFGQCPGARGDRWRVHLGPIRKGEGYRFVLRGGVNAHHGVLALRLIFPSHKAGTTAEYTEGFVASIDWFGAETRHPVTKRTAPFAVPVSGQAVLEGEVRERHERSLGYWMCIDSVALVADGSGDGEGAGQDASMGGADDNGDDDEGDMDETSWPFG